MVFISKELWSVGYGYMECDDSVEWSFVCPENERYVLVPDDEWLILVPDIYWMILVSTVDNPLKTQENRQRYKLIIWSKVL